MSFNPKSHLIAFVGGKGGVGKSVLASNFAIALSKELRARTLLIDADAQSCGDQNILLGVTPNKTLSEVAQFVGSINAQTVGALVTKHVSGIGYIGAVKNPTESLRLDASLIDRPLEDLSQIFQYIVVDLGSALDDLQLQILNHASMVMVVTTPEILAINQASRLIGDFAAATLPTDLVQVVVNKTNSASMNPGAIQTMLKRPVIGVVPQDDRTVLGCLQRGAPAVLAQPQSPVALSVHDLVRKVTGSGLLQSLKTIAKPSELKMEKRGGNANLQIEGAKSTMASGNSRGAGEPSDPRTLLKLRIHQELIKAMDLRKQETDTKGDPEKEEALRRKTQQTITQIVDKESKGLGREERAQLIKEILDEALGLGPLEDLLAEDAVSEIMVNGYNQIFIERSGRLTLSKVTFTSNFHLRNVIRRIVNTVGRQINESSPYVDARLKDGSRVNAVIEPIAIDGPSLTIRKFAKSPITIKNYLEWGSINQSMIDFLRICVENGLNIVISGGTGSGKTTLLNTMSSFIPVTERIVTVEDAAELQLKQEHVVRLETRPANMEGSGAVTIRDLVRNSLRMRPDRIIVGECRGGEALDMLSAMNTGHDGSMTTVHANNPAEAIARIETLCMMAGMELPAAAIRKQIASAIDLIIQISKLSDGSRKVKS
ncbi:MAG: Flp pilus assembly complex ATPase component TadA, partial [Bdellovibrionales bacterium]|nr:Flp pilus assembly complex ATPase component TadA [Bdellovibrionales bacterium]